MRGFDVHGVQLLRWPVPDFVQRRRELRGVHQRERHEVLGVAGPGEEPAALLHRRHVPDVRG